MDNDVAVGMNRTGLDMAPKSKATLVDFARQQAGQAPRERTDLQALRHSVALEASRVGTVPVPARMKGVASTVMDTLKGHKPQVLIDKLGERLAYERTGVRLYEALIAKAGAAAGGPMLDMGELARIRDEERAHFELVADALHGMGADPTAVTPCADTVGVAGMGHLQVVTDPRTTVSQALNSMLMVELGDNAGWELLIELARDSGHGVLAQQFEVALQTEQRHLGLVKGWLREAVLDEST